MTRNFAITVGIGVVLVAAALSFLLYSNRGSHLEITGQILKVRTLQLDESNSAVVFDFRVANPSDYPIKIRQINSVLTLNDGSTVESQDVSVSDAKRMFEYYKSLGDQYNDYLKAQDKLPAKSTMDRMIVMRFEVPFGKLESRKSIQLHIEDAQGTEANFTK